MFPQAVLGIKIKIMNTQFIVILGTVFITVYIVKFAKAWKEFRIVFSLDKFEQEQDVPAGLKLMT